jgi:hypothetical protein
MTKIQERAEAGVPFRKQLNARHLASMVKIQGTLCISGLINLRKCKSVIARYAQLALHRAFQ